MGNTMIGNWLNMAQVENLRHTGENMRHTGLGELGTKLINRAYLTSLWSSKFKVLTFAESKA
jgi:hypothetical protein